MKYNSWTSYTDLYPTEHLQNPGTHQINQTLLDSVQRGAQSAATEAQSCWFKLEEIYSTYVGKGNLTGLNFKVIQQNSSLQRLSNLFT